MLLPKIYNTKIEHLCWWSPGARQHVRITDASWDFPCRGTNNHISHICHSYFCVIYIWADSTISWVVLYIFVRWYALVWPSRDWPEVRLEFVELIPNVPSFPWFYILSPSSVHHLTSYKLNTPEVFPQSPPDTPVSTWHPSSPPTTCPV